MDYTTLDMYPSLDGGKKKHKYSICIPNTLRKEDNAVILYHTIRCMFCQDWLGFNAQD